MYLVDFCNLWTVVAKSLAWYILSRIIFFYSEGKANVLYLISIIRNIYKDIAPDHDNRTN